MESHEHALPVCNVSLTPRPQPRTVLRAVATQQWYHLPLIDGPRERLSSPGAIDGRLAPASDGRPANDPRLLAPPIETLAKLLRDDSGRNAILLAAAASNSELREGGEIEADAPRRSCVATALLYNDLCGHR